MIDLATFSTLAGQCAMGQPWAPLAAIVKRASDFEPLVLTTMQSGGVLSVQAMSKEEGIRLASEMKLAGQPVRIGLAGIDTRELDRFGIGLDAAFEPCANIRVAARLLVKNPRALKPLAAAAQGIPTNSLSQDRRPRQTAAPLPAEGPELPEPAVVRPARAWDVYGQARANSVLVYGGAE